MKLQDRVAIVTGAAGGIGHAVARAFAREGASLCLADIRPMADLAAELRAAGRAVIEVIADVSSAADTEMMAARAEQTLGPVDILVNAAGVPSHGSAGDTTEADWDRVLSINLKGTFLCCRAVMEGMRARRHGRIVNIGSVLAKNGGNPRPWLDRSEQMRSGNVAYGASKAGVHALTLFLAKELAADGITVNAVAPGPIAVPMRETKPLHRNVLDLIPLGRMGRAEEVAEAVLFLASDGASFITAEILDVNGGLFGD